MLLLELVGLPGVARREKLCANLTTAEVRVSTPVGWGAGNQGEAAKGALQRLSSPQGGCPLILFRQEALSSDSD